MNKRCPKCRCPLNDKGKCRVCLHQSVLLTAVDQLEADFPKGSFVEIAGERYKVVGHLGDVSGPKLWIEMPGEPAAGIPHAALVSPPKRSVI
jgi:hypothetical protein